MSILINGCEKNTHKTGEIQQKEKELLKHLIINEGFLRASGDTSGYLTNLNNILSNFGISRDSLTGLIKRLSSDPKKLAIIMDEIKSEIAVEDDSTLSTYLFATPLKGK